MVSAHPLASRAGEEILRAGGNAFDAAVAVSAVLAVVEPYSSGLGGGGFWLLHRASDGRQVMLDGRETAPAAARPELYQDADGNPAPESSRIGGKAAAIPGMPAALLHLAENYGRLPVAHSLAPAIRYARSGFTVTARYRRLTRYRLPVLRADPYSAAIFLAQNEVPPAGHLIIQEELAATLERLGAQGRAAFYSGVTARHLVQAVRQAGGVWELRDLATYSVVEREPVVFQYHGIRVVSAAPPSSGGVVLGEALNILERFSLPKNSPARTHLVVEALRRAYRDRAQRLGDPDFTAIPVAQLLSKSYGARQAQDISLDRATASSALPGPQVFPAPESEDTTHFCVLDEEGNRVAATLSINLPFGAGLLVPGTGVLLNDEMDDFAFGAGIPNAYGLVGGQANIVAGGKRPLSSMSPTFLETPRRVALLGTPGGSRIISMVLLAVLDFAEGAGPRSWVALPRYHHQYLPDQLQFEQGALSAEAQEALRAMGHTLDEKDRRYGNMQAILWDLRHDRVEAASDLRGEGQARVFYTDFSNQTRKIGERRGNAMRTEGKLP